MKERIITEQKRKELEKAEIGSLVSVKGKLYKVIECSDSLRATGRCYNLKHCDFSVNDVAIGGYSICSLFSCMPMCKNGTTVFRRFKEVKK